MDLYTVSLPPNTPLFGRQSHLKKAKGGMSEAPSTATEIMNL